MHLLPANSGDESGDVLKRQKVPELAMNMTSDAFVLIQLCSVLRASQDMKGG